MNFVKFIKSLQIVSKQDLFPLSQSRKFEVHEEFSLENFERKNSPKRNVEIEQFLRYLFHDAATFCPPIPFSISVLLRLPSMHPLAPRERGHGTFTPHLRRTKTARKFSPPRSRYKQVLNKFDAFNNSFGRNLAREATMLFLNQWME